MTRYKRRLLAAFAVVGLLAAGCGGSDGGDGTSTSASADGSGSSSAGSVSDRAVQYAECMRENGVSDFPDPTEDGRVMLRVGPGGIEVDPATMDAAQAACQDLAPAGAGRANPQMEASVFRFAECMRANGVPDFPDPDVQGGAVRMQLPRGIDPQSPQFQEAQQACQGEMQGMAQGGAP